MAKFEQGHDNHEKVEGKMTEEQVANGNNLMLPASFAIKLIKQGKTAEAEHRMKLVKKEISNYA